MLVPKKLNCKKVQNPLNENYSIPVVSFKINSSIMQIESLTCKISKMKLQKVHEPEHAQVFPKPALPFIYLT